MEPGNQQYRQGVQSTSRIRPSFDVKEEQLSFLAENDFKVPEISAMLGVSTRTVERRLSSFGISISGKSYVLKGMVQCLSRHFTVAVKDDSLWVYIDDMCSSVRKHTSCHHLLHGHPKVGFLQ